MYHSMKEVCREVGLSYETLKFYCNAGLIPNVKRDEQNRRIFDDKTVGWIKGLICLRRCGMRINEMKAFKGIAEKVVPGAIPALDCPVIFDCAPNALIIGFIVAMITSTITIILTAGMFPTIVIPLTVTCFFENGCASIIGNATGGIRGCIIGAILSGIIMVLLVGFGSYFFGNTIGNWMLVYGGQDFSLWGIVEGFIARLL